jgi:hypothetical protein
MRSAKAVISEKLVRLGTSTAAMSYGTATSQRGPSHTLTSLKRWSVATKDLPGERAGCASETVASSVNLELTVACGLAVSQIKTIHVYDFDNTRENHRSSRHPRPQI